MTRDTIQGFIDGYIYAGGDPALVNDALSEWMGTHPVYPATVEEKAAVASDLASYRVSEQSVLAPSKAAQVQL